MKKREYALVVGVALLLAVAVSMGGLLAAPLSRDRDPDYQFGRYVAYAVAGDAVIYKGALVCVNSDGYLEPADDAAGIQFVGVAQQATDATGASDGDYSCLVLTEGSVTARITGASQASIGRPLYAVDDQTVATGTGVSHNVAVGTMTHRISATWIRFRLLTTATPTAASG